MKLTTAMNITMVVIILFFVAVILADRLGSPTKGHLTCWKDGQVVFDQEILSRNYQAHEGYVTISTQQGDWLLTGATCHYIPKN